MLIAQTNHAQKTPPQIGKTKDLHSYSNPQQVTIKHLHLDLEVDFEQQVLRGQAILDLERITPNEPLVLDTMDLDITKVEITDGDSDYDETRFSLGASDPILGSPLTIDLNDTTNRVRIAYSTRPGAKALQWLLPQQTAGKRNPFMFTQSQPINARSWIPVQDSPEVRITYSASIKTPSHLLAVMGAANNPSQLKEGVYEFIMPQPIPSYLIALAVGDLMFESLGPRTGVYAEPQLLKKAAREFSDTERMMNVTEALYGNYRWDRYDLLLLPPSFPLGGMENPRLTFLTPTILAGDKSLVSLIAHELAHSWAGNLVTNATWSDFWLNEGVTTYVERRVIEELYGREREEMEASIALAGLQDEMATLEIDLQILHVNLKDRDPDEGTTLVPYQKGALLLRQVEEVFGRELFDRFLRDYFARFAFKSISTAEFAAYLRKELLDTNQERAKLIPLDEWLYQPGLPDSTPRPSCDAFDRIEEQANRWLSGELDIQELSPKNWNTHEWLHFLKYLPKTLERARMVELDTAFHLTNVENSEIAHVWLLLAIQTNYEIAYPRLSEYLKSIGREKLIKPLYEELVKSPGGREEALKIYEVARATYHPIVTRKLDKILSV